MLRTRKSLRARPGRMAVRSALSTGDCDSHLPAQAGAGAGAGQGQHPRLAVAGHRHASLLMHATAAGVQCHPLAACLLTAPHLTSPPPHPPPARPPSRPSAGPYFLQTAKPHSVRELRESSPCTAATGIMKQSARPKKAAQPTRRRRLRSHTRHLHAAARPRVGHGGQHVGVSAQARARHHWLEAVHYRPQV